MDTLVAELVQDLAIRMVSVFGASGPEGSDERQTLILNQLAAANFARCVKKDGYWIWKATKKHVRHLGPAARRLQPTPARLESKNNAALQRLKPVPYQANLVEIFEITYANYVAVGKVLLQLEQDGKYVRLRAPNGRIGWTKTATWKHYKVHGGEL